MAEKFQKWPKKLCSMKEVGQEVNWDFTLLTNHFSTTLGSGSQTGIKEIPYLTAFAERAHFWEACPEGLGKCGPGNL